MALHELTVNAVKYGSLSVAHGKVRVSWGSSVQDDGLMFRLSWIEQNGPPVQRPARRGRGTQLIERMIAYQLHGEASLRFEPSGVRCSLRFPIEPVSAEVSS